MGLKNASKYIIMGFVLKKVQTVLGRKFSTKQQHMQYFADSYEYNIFRRGRMAKLDTNNDLESYHLPHSFYCVQS